MRLLRPRNVMRLAVLVLAAAAVGSAAPAAVEASAATGRRYPDPPALDRAVPPDEEAHCTLPGRQRAQGAPGTGPVGIRVREQRRVRALQAALQIAMTPRYKTDASGALVPDVRAAAAIIFNPETGQVLWEENAQDKRSIASITKVMTAVVFLEDNPDLTPGGHDRAQRRLRRVDDLPPGERADLARRPAAPDADRVRQRRRPRARPRSRTAARRRSSSG